MNKFLTRKGQFSFDLIFTILAVIIFLQFITTFSVNYTDTQSSISLHDQKTSIAVSVKNAINACQILKSSGSSAQIQFQLSNLYDFTQLGTCQVSYDNENKNIVISSTSIEGIEEKYTLAAPEVISGFNPVKCGETLIINC